MFKHVPQAMTDLWGQDHTKSLQLVHSSSHPQDSGAPKCQEPWQELRMCREEETVAALAGRVVSEGGACVHTHPQGKYRMGAELEVKSGSAL